MRRLALVLTLLLLAAGHAAAAVRTVDRGIIVRVRPFAIVIRELDGSRVRIPVSVRTLVMLDGQPAQLRDLQRGDVAYVVHVKLRPATQIRAFTR